MGLFRKEAPHVNRSSRTPSGIRWKHEPLRLLGASIAASCVIVFMLMMLSAGIASAQHAKQPLVKKQTVVKKAIKSVASAKAHKLSKKSSKPVVAKKNIKKNKQTVSKKKLKLVSNKKLKPVAETKWPKGVPDKKFVKKIIRGVTVYAYAVSSSKNKKRRIDAYTSSGTKATEGRTIAVDPKQIPIGYWVYVEGLGYRKAEDVGGAIKGKKIDVFVSSISKAMQFGVKKNRKIYVIGPNLPKVAKAKALPKSSTKATSKKSKAI